MVDGKIYGLPYEVEPMAMYYSVDAFNEVGLTEKDIPKTWEELLSVAKKLTNRSATASCSRPIPAIIKTSPGIPSYGKPAATSKPKTARALSTRRRPWLPLKFWQDAVNTGVAPRKPLGGGAWDSVPNLARAIARCRIRASGRSRNCAKACPTSNMACSSCQRLRGEISHHRRRLGDCRQREGIESESRRRVRRLGVGFAEGRLDRPNC